MNQLWLTKKKLIAIWISFNGFNVPPGGHLHIYSMINYFTEVTALQTFSYQMGLKWYIVLNIYYKLKW